MLDRISKGNKPVRSLSIISVLLAIITPIQTSNVFSNCLSLSHNILNCSGLNIKEIPSLMTLPKQTEVLDLSCNDISTITRINISIGNNLKGISLSRNSITKIESNPFQDVEKLEFLDLSFNRIKGPDLLDKTDFEVMKFTALKELSLRGNPLGTMSRLTFTASGYLHLQYLDLSQCSIKTLEASAIEGLPVLKTVNFSHNYLEEYNPNSVESQLELTSLDLSFNRIKTIREFPLSMSLLRINLQNNKITYIEDNAFSPVTNLQFLNLENNNLKELSPLSVPWNDAQIALRGNPWQCDCNMKWMKLPSKDVNTKGINASILCAYPSRLRGKYLQQLSASNLSCATSYLGPVIAALLSSLVIIISVGTAFILYQKRKSILRKQSCDQGGDYVAVYTLDETDETESKVTFSDERRLIGEKEIYA